MRGGARRAPVSVVAGHVVKWRDSQHRHLVLVLVLVPVPVPVPVCGDDSTLG